MAVSALAHEVSLFDPDPHEPVGRGGESEDEVGHGHRNYFGSIDHEKLLLIP